MKADPAVQRRLLDLAEVDAELARIDYRRARLPEHAEVTEAEESLRAVEERHTDAQGTRVELDTEIERQERDVESVRARAERDRELLRSGSLGAKQLTDVEHELDSVLRRQESLEDDLLELMERRETAAGQEQHATAELDRLHRVADDARQRRDTALAELDENRSGRETDRAALAPEFPAELLEEYDRVRAARGAGAGLLRSGRCGACQLEFDRSTLSELRHAAGDTVVFCDNCGAVLVRTEESGL